ncbi:MAG: archaellin/type IV pilin N-terminal domain-containing protein [Candidatus Thermoplasmatota archaeon]|jgi:flagellin-like protein|nr:archaellin/type IV pilin N-terminal domain-containing protein [Candidatus Thermoplasmatota archaeon]|tara:strand:- start:95 stop:613 length:519 start_codon:yes stop_codon:yes gene_type:complete
MAPPVDVVHPATGKEDKNMKNETRNDEAVSPVIATILMVAITVVLAGVLYVWAANLAESNTDGSLELYTFSGADAPGSDGAVIMTMDSGSDLGWASITIKASVNGAASVTVDQCASGETEDCWSSTDSDADNWNVGEAITVDTDCTGVCTVTVNVLNSREGTTLDTTIIDAE